MRETKGKSIRHFGTKQKARETGAAAETKAKAGPT